MTKQFSRQIKGMLAALALALASAFNAHAADDTHIVLASTTSTENSGLFDYIVPKIKDDTGVDVRVVAVGTGAALDMGKRCDADALLVHAKAQELDYVEHGYGVDRQDVMYNDFILVGPGVDPAGISDIKDAADALRAIKDDASTFLSRGDESGTHVKERDLWQAAHLEPWNDAGKWYRETGAGMGPTLNSARGMDAYTLSDRATWISFKNKGDLDLLLDGDERLFNQYGVMLVNPERCPNTRVEPATKVIDWLVSERGQDVIASYQLEGEQLFYPNANDDANP